VNIEVATAPGSPSDGAVVGVDLGGTKLAAILVDAHGVQLHRVQHRIAGYPDALDAVAAAVAECRRAGGRSAGRITAVGVAVAGPLDRDRERVLAALNLGFADQPLRRDLAQLLDVPVVLENDANAAAFAEYRFGAARGCRSLLLLTLGTGIGGGLVIDGEIVTGGRGAAAELGHLPVDPDGEPCGCGARGCLEQYASGSALARIAGMPGRLLVAAATRGDRAASDLLTGAGDRIGRALAALTPVVDPDLVLLSGGLAHAAATHLLPPIQAALDRYCPFRAQRPAPEVRLAACGVDGGALGAAALAGAAVDDRSAGVALAVELGDPAVHLGVPATDRAVR